MSDELVANIANALIVEPIATLTPEEEFRILANGLSKSFATPTLVEMRQTGAELHAFIRRVVDSMEAMRPWSNPEYIRLPADALAAFARPRPIARIRIPVPGVEGRLARTFEYGSEDGPFLLLRLRSGADIGFFSPVWPGSDDVMVASADNERDPHSILTELMDTGRFEADKVVSLIESGLELSGSTARYQTTPIQPSFRGEQEPGNKLWGGKHVRYLTEEERKNFRIIASNGLLYDAKGNLFDTSSARTLWTPTGGRAIFAMDQFGILYSAHYHILGEFHHSSLLAGEPAAGAGEIAVMQGQVHLISDHSTHYRPTRRFTNQVVESLRRQGLQVADLQIEYHSPE
ncbi:hypothetical protein ACFC06_22660 [Nocardia sp. NPDC056064]|uniref:hypothetical protein n=1 Tax=Nocardia sp. NPDC056064 TaxID=3345701 RepID=UPI0035DF3046